MSFAHRGICLFLVCLAACTSTGYARPLALGPFPVRSGVVEYGGDRGSAEADRVMRAACNGRYTTSDVAYVSEYSGSQSMTMGPYVVPKPRDRSSVVMLFRCGK